MAVVVAVVVAFCNKLAVRGNVHVSFEDGEGGRERTRENEKEQKRRGVTQETGGITDGRRST